MAANRDNSAKTRTRQALVRLLKQEGALDVATLSERLELTAMAVRLHLKDLHEQGLVRFTEEPRPMGRPAQVWTLTEAANDLFPAGYAELTLNLVDSMQRAFGNQGLDRILDVRKQQQKQAYLAQMKNKNTLPARLRALAAIRTREGYMAEVQRRDDGDYELIEKHCPICAVAKNCTSLCRNELELFDEVLGSDVQVTRTEHIVQGGRRCVYRITREHPRESATDHKRLSAGKGKR
ncbi:helix-turn-helix transcriptional regulator [Phycisphaerales bacterium AB-hyl4]|uniref:Helix-turn-helix transcriptional regulator n=1 Tax=Natronomicrosphaera hydrolytica TaxID=3242702 RepID=A0ABV4U4Y4_9BACT